MLKGFFTPDYIMKPVIQKLEKMNIIEKVDSSIIEITEDCNKTKIMDIKGE